MVVVLTKTQLPQHNLSSDASVVYFDYSFSTLGLRFHQLTLPAQTSFQLQTRCKNSFKEEEKKKKNSKPQQGFGGAAKFRMIFYLGIIHPLDTSCEAPWGHTRDHPPFAE